MGYEDLWRTQVGQERGPGDGVGGQTGGTEKSTERVYVRHVLGLPTRIFIQRSTGTGRNSQNPILGFGYCSRCTATDQTPDGERGHGSE